MGRSGSEHRHIFYLEGDMAKCAIVYLFMCCSQCFDWTVRELESKLLYNFWEEFFGDICG